MDDFHGFDSNDPHGLLGLSPNTEWSIVGSAPVWEISRVQAIAKERNGLLLKRTRAIDSFSSAREAYTKARQVIADLTESQFSETVKLRFDMECDV
jgi:hypothetical protein